MEALLQIYVLTLNEIVFIFEAMEKADNQINFDSLDRVYRYLQGSVQLLQMAIHKMSDMTPPGETLDKYVDIVQRGHWRDYV